MNDSLNNVPNHQNTDSTENMNNDLGVDIDSMVDDNFAHLYGPCPQDELLLIVDEEDTPLCDDTDDIQTDELLEKLKKRVAGLERKIDDQMTLVYGSPHICPTRHGCSGSLNCDYEYASIQETDPNLKYKDDKS